MLNTLVATAGPESVIPGGEWPRKFGRFVQIWWSPIRCETQRSIFQIGKYAAQLCKYGGQTQRSMGEEGEDHGQRPRAPAEPARPRETSREPEEENLRAKGKKEVDQQKSTV